RIIVCPVILMKGKKNAFEDEDYECTRSDVVKIGNNNFKCFPCPQVWRAAFLCADYILLKGTRSEGCSVLELGGGTGITSIIIGNSCQRVYCTDVGEDLLTMCEQNVALNKHLMEQRSFLHHLRILSCTPKPYSFLQISEASYSWSEEEIADLLDHCSVIMAADVFYDDDLTDALFRTLYRITHNLRNSCTVYLALEKRLNFTLRHMDITCEAYSHFRNTINDLENLQDGKMKYTVEPIKLDFCQFLVYERIEQL
ncbi:MET22 protein, partial [Vidua chalybeata]|nr:MET22 protein [Vidua chalybeata]